MRRSDSFIAGVFTIALSSSLGAFAVALDAPDLREIKRVHEGNIVHCDATVAEGFEAAFDCGDELFEASFNAIDGVGANVGDGGRFTRVPRADLVGAGEWARHFPIRATGPNAESCISCHLGAALGGGGDGSGPAALNVVRDPLQSAAPGRFIQRNTPHLFGPGALQRLAEEMTLGLRADRDRGIRKACRKERDVEVPLRTKGVSFGQIRVDCHGVVDTRGLEGIDEDLLVRPFQWKGTDESLRAFSRGAAHNELGMQPVEITGDGVDGDGDGVVDEITIADMTALSVYLAAQPRPVSELELDRLRRALRDADRADLIAELQLPKLSQTERRRIREGKEIFETVGCADCHHSSLRIEEPIFSEPSVVAGYRDDPFPAGQPALAETIRFDLTRDMPDNQFEVGGRRFDLGNFELDRRGRAIVRLYGDLKRHDMGPGLGENIDESGDGASVWMTKELWGVGSTAPYLHDGRATTLGEAILAHDGEAAASRIAFQALHDGDAKLLIRFLENLVLFFPAE